MCLQNDWDHEKGPMTKPKTEPCPNGGKSLESRPTSLLNHL